jgi:hypothetical protein
MCPTFNTNILYIESKVITHQNPIISLCVLVLPWLSKNWTIRVLSSKSSCSQYCRENNQQVIGVSQPLDFFCFRNMHANLGLFLFQKFGIRHDRMMSFLYWWFKILRHGITNLLNIHIDNLQVPTLSLGMRK